MDKMSRPWKEASTIILTALKKSLNNFSYNYEILTLQRSSKSSFMPNGHVFPGGMTEPADSDKKWLDLFKLHDLDIRKTCQIINGNIPPILANNCNEVPKILSLKITAVRETFEETGVLLCLKKNQNPKNSNGVSFCTFDNISIWREKIQKDAQEFFNMCQNFKCCPDVSNIHLWSNWLTPTSLGLKRFDTAFFIACLNENPGALTDNKEIEELNWVAPDVLMNLCKNKKIWLPPPQVYETARLLNFENINNLNDFAKVRSIQGCERWMPIQKKTSNGSVSLLPGDDAYKSTDPCTSTEAEQNHMSNEEFRQKSEVLHRLEFTNKTVTKVIIKNYNPTNGHVIPMSDF